MGTIPAFVGSSWCKSAEHAKWHAFSKSLFFFDLKIRGLRNTRPFFQLIRLLSICARRGQNHHATQIASPAHCLKILGNMAHTFIVPVHTTHMKMNCRNFCPLNGLQQCNDFGRDNAGNVIPISKLNFILFMLPYENVRSSSL